MSDQTSPEPPTAQSSAASAASAAASAASAASAAAQLAQAGTEEDGDPTRQNLLLVGILGAALIGLVVCIIVISLRKEPLPDGLTSLTSLIAGGLVAILAPASGAVRRGSNTRTKSAGK
jgi:hypothetical protein